MNQYKFLIPFLCTILLIGCSKNDDLMDQSVYSDLSIEFDHVVGGQKLILEHTNYRNAAEELYSVDLLQYYISNIQLVNKEGILYTVPVDSSYFLIDAANMNSRFAKVNIPVGDYHTLKFIIGVDSLRNTMDISKRMGVLDPQHNMYWGWNSGYIFFKMEGKSVAVPTEISNNQQYRFHIGGFGGYSTSTINNIKTIEIPLQQRGISQVREGRKSNIHLMVDISKVFNGTQSISLSTHSQVMFSDFSMGIANNYSTMFVHDHTEN